MNDLTFNILKIVVTVVTALISACLIPYIREKYKEAKYQQLLEIIDIAVKAAEQSPVLKSEFGSIKKKEVIEFVSDWMTKRGMTITNKQLDQLIEAAVYAMKQAKVEE